MRRAGRATRRVAAAIAVCVVAGSCSSGSGTGTGPPPSTAPAASNPTTASAPPATSGVNDDWLVDGRVSEAAMVGVVDGTAVDVARVDQLVIEVLAMDAAGQAGVVADLSRRTELLASAISGLADELGGPDAAATSIATAWDAAAPPVDDAVDAASVVEPAGWRRPAQTPTAADIGAVGLGLGWFAVASITTTLVGGSNTAEAGPAQTSPVRDGVSITSGLDTVGLAIEYKGTEGGVDVTFKATSTLQPCPDPNGAVRLEAKIDVSTSANGRGQNATMDVTVDAVVGDDAEVASSEVANRIQWADFGGGGGQFVDMTFTGDAGFGSGTVNRTGGTVTSEFVNMAATLSRLLGGMLALQMLDAAKSAWKSGRCVRLEVTAQPGPSGLEPSSTAVIVASPRSKVDGAVTGGTVTALLTAGGDAVDPSSTPLQADAEFTYTAPAERDRSGTVELEARSRRGIGKAAITLDTNGQAYTASFSGDGLSITGTVRDLSAPFTLDGVFPGGTAAFAHTPADDRGGSVTVAGGGGGATLTGGGSYTVADNGDGTLTLTAQINSCVDVSKICRDSTLPILLTPA